MFTNRNRTVSFVSQQTSAAHSPSAAPQNRISAPQSHGRRLSVKGFLGAALVMAGIGLLAAQPTSAQTPKNAPVVQTGRRANLPEKLEFDSKSITFRHGVPVGGWSHLTLYPDGHYHFSGHFHVSGAPSYNVGIVWMVRSSAGQAFMFSKTGHLHGTFESGSRDCNWDASGSNEDIKRSYAELVGNKAGYKANVNADLSSLIADAKQVVSVAGDIVSAVSVVAL